MKLSSGSVFVAAAGVIILGAITAGLFALGSPADERNRRVDQRRVVDLQRVAAAIDLYWTRYDRLPASVRELGGEPGIQINTADPETRAPYDYVPTDSATYEVCANFVNESGEMSSNRRKNVWAHGAGRQCFQLEAEDVNDDRR
jgi:hypothetical protein